MPEVDAAERGRFDRVDVSSPPEYANSFPDHVDSWDEYFLRIATVVAIKSKDPRCSVGAVIVSHDHILRSTGFNGLARRVHDDQNLLADAEEKLKVICHAEANAIFNAARTRDAVWVR